MNQSEYQQLLMDCGFSAEESRRIAGCRCGRQAQAPARIVVESKGDGDDDREAELYMYGPIGFSWDGSGVTPKQLVDQLAALGKVNRITVRLNSPGGDVFDALAISNILRRQQCTVAVSIDALAASAATIVAMAASPGELTIAENGMMMVHRAWAVAVGNTNDMTDMASILEKIDGQIAATYAARSGRKQDTWLKLMEEETWMTGTEAVEHKLADQVTAAKQAAASIDLTALGGFRNVPTTWAARLQGEREAQERQREAEATQVRLRLLELDELSA